MTDIQKKLAILPDNPLCGISTYKDTLNLTTGVCTRYIKKIVFDGTENWQGAYNSASKYLADILDYKLGSEITCMSTHYSGANNIVSGDPIPNNSACFYNANSPRLLYLKGSEPITVADFKAYLAQQYANGTPVTVWYVLATPEETTITVPSGLSGTVEGYLIQDGTPTPTSPIYPTANNVEVWQHSLRKLTTATDTITTLPANLYADGNSATVGISGNTVQSGTPTPQNPIQPSETGDKTANLFNVGAYSSALLTNCTIAVTNNVVTQTNAGTLARSAWKIDGLQVGTDYTMAAKITNPNQTECQIRIYDSTNSSAIINSSASKATSITLSVTFTAVTSTHYIRLYSNTSSATANTYSVEFSDIMLNVGSTALPYEPYGMYKIPISSGGVTTNIYLGSTQTVREIKKYEFTGNEQWTQSGARPAVCYTPWSAIGGTPYGHFYCDRAVEVETQWNLAYGKALSDNNLALWIFESAVTATEFKQYLAEQYANGTPVTVWYVLAEPTTAAVNEPLRKIGDYADTVSGITIPTITGADRFDVETTLKPSEVSLSYTGWHNATVKEKSRNLWNESYTGIMQDFIIYLPLNVGDGDYTLSSTATREGEVAVLFLLAGNVSTGATTVNNGVWNGQSRTVAAVDGYITIGYRKYPTANPENANTMLNTGSTALPYEPYWK